VGKHSGKLEAAEKVGIQTARAGDFVPRADADVVVDASGTTAGLELAMQAVRPRGTIVLKSTFSRQSSASGTVNLTPLVVNEVTVVGSRCGPFPAAIRALAAREVDVSALISQTFHLSEGLAALEAAADGKNLKVLLDMR
jgi:threonine dehydrogenase-like Zn-dependent dehydrogenase